METFFFKLAALVYFTYVEVKELYQQRIELLKKLYKDYGYFMNYYFFCEMNFDIEFYQQIFYCYWCADPFKYKEPDYIEYMATKPTKSFFYDRSRIRTGLIPDLYYLGYYDLLDEYLEECFLPICLNYGKRTGKYDEIYGYKISEENIRGVRYIIDPIKFLREQNYKLPKELDEFWKERWL